MSPDQIIVTNLVVNAWAPLRAKTDLKPPQVDHLAYRRRQDIGAWSAHRRRPACPCRRFVGTLHSQVVLTLVPSQPDTPPPNEVPYPRPDQGL
jgi:hypothetical protein